MMETGVEDQYAGKTHTATAKTIFTISKIYRQRRQDCCYCSSFTPSRKKKFTVIPAYISLTAAITVFFYYFIYLPDMEHRISKNVEIHREKNSPLDGEKERTKHEYDQLLNYILHPQTPCKTSLVLGGKVEKNKKVDGDKILCLDPGPGFGEECIVYSFGINNEWSFDEAMHKKFGCSVYAFDPSMNMGDHLHSEGVWFYNLGIGGYNANITFDGQVWELNTLDTIIDQLNHTGKAIDLLKMDIEGAELEVLEYILNNRLLNRVNHLCVEIHLLSYPYWTQVLNLFRRIEESGLKHFSTRNNTQSGREQVPGVPERYEKHFFEMAWYRP